MSSKLYLHIGHGKTGSSYIQSCLANSIHLLDIKKIYYPIDEQERLKACSGKISSGNGSMLLQPDIHKLIKKAIPFKDEKILFSNELLMKHLLCNKHNIWRNIANLKKQININEVNILLFVRNPFDMINSIYQQMIKRDRWYLHMDDYLYHYVNHFKDVLGFLKLIAEKNQISLKILNYSYIKHTIISEVENWLQLDKTKLLLPEVSIINRSLTKGEIEFQKSLNKILGPCGFLLADHLCEKLPHIPSERFTLSTSAKKTFIQDVEPIIIEINTMVDHKHRLSLEDLHDDLTNDTEHFIFTKDQIRVIADSFALKFANQRNRINILRKRQDLITRSLLFRISRKLNNFTKIKKFIKLF